MSGTHACGLTAAGAAYCWGNNLLGDLGDSTTTDRDAPVAVVGGHTFSHISTGRWATCGITSDEVLYCWGERVGNGVASRYYTFPIQVPVPALSSVHVGGTGTCSVDSAGTGWCWGDNNFGQLGNGTTDPATSPTAVTGDFQFSGGGLAVGNAHACAITLDGLTYCWGASDEGQTGQVGTHTTLAPQLIPGQQ
jgi:alpha-tubulin suppressor-like RCC1 family protein